MFWVLKFLVLAGSVYDFDFIIFVNDGRLESCLTRPNTEMQAKQIIQHTRFPRRYPSNNKLPTDPIIPDILLW